MLILVLFDDSFLGLINVDGKLWRGQRKFLHEKLRGFGMKQIGRGKEQLEARIMVSFPFFTCMALFPLSDL